MSDNSLVRASIVWPQASSLKPQAFAVLLFCSLLCAPAARADDTSALINQALDKQVKLQLNNVLPAAMDAIAKQTGVRVDVDPAVYDLLPWGQDTNINAKIENQTLREALQAITRKLGLTFELGDESLRLEPMPALRRLGRRSTVEELGALDKLASTPLELTSNRPTVKQVIDAVDAKLEAGKAPYAVESHCADAVRQDQVVSIARNATCMDALESLTKQTGATWYPWGKTILVIPKQEQVRRELGKAITVHYAGADLAQVMTDLQKRSGVHFVFEPGAIQQVAPEARTIHLRLDNSSVQEALEAISGVTGIEYMVRDDGIYLWKAATLGAQHDPVLIFLPLPENGAQILVHESQISPDLRAYIQAKTQRELDKLRTLMIEEGFHPATQPTTKP